MKDEKPQKLGEKLPSINMVSPIDPTRVTIANAAPPDQSIYSNPVTMYNTIRTPASNQVGGQPNMKLPQK